MRPAPPRSRAAASSSAALTQTRPRSPGASTSRWLGANRSVNHLRDTFARVAAQRSPELLTVLGEPGIGKSRLVAELTAIAGADGTVLTGHCRPYGEGITMWPLREAVAQARGDLSADKLAAALGIPAIAVRRVAAAVGLEDGEPGEDTEWAFLQLVGALARVRPLVIVVDDAHWAEPALLDLLLELVARLRHTPAARRVGRAPRPA